MGGGYMDITNVIYRKLKLGIWGIWGYDKCNYKNMGY